MSVITVLSAKKHLKIHLPGLSRNGTLVKRRLGIRPDALKTSSGRRERGSTGAAGEESGGNGGGGGGDPRI